MKNTLPHIHNTFSTYFKSTSPLHQQTYKQRKIENLNILHICKKKTISLFYSTEYLSQYFVKSFICLILCYMCSHVSHWLFCIVFNHMYILVCYEIELTQRECERKRGDKINLFLHLPLQRSRQYTHIHTYTIHSHSADNSLILMLPTLTQSIVFSLAETHIL